MIVGLIGYARVGKETVYQQVFKGLKYKRLVFADVLKQEVATAFGVTVKEIETHKKQWRELLVAWGEQRRQQYPTYWIDKVAAQLEPDTNYCIRKETIKTS